MRLATISVVLLACAACATSSEKRLDEKIAARPPVEGSGAIRDEAAQLIEAAPGLTDSQRDRLRELQASTRTKMEALAQQSLKLRSLLVQDTLALDDNSKEITLVQAKLKSVEADRLNIVFDAVRKASSILGKEAAVKNERLFQDLVGGRADRG